MGRGGAILLVVAAFALPSIGSAQKLYKWKDENGVIQYGDKIPPEYANRDREVLNNQAVRIGSEDGVTDEEAEANRRAKDEAAHDRVLRGTYSSVADIEHLRDQRFEQRESQIKVTEVNLNHLRKRLADLQAEASNYKPYSTREDAPQVPEVVARDLSQTTSAIFESEQDIARMRRDQAAEKKTFDDDIARFRELKSE